MMKGLFLCALLVLLTAGAAGAEWQSGPGTFCDENKFCYVSTWEAYKKYLNGDSAELDKDKCLDKMEAAMRAMDIYLPYVHNGRALDPFELQKVIDGLTSAGKLWAETKRECWKGRE